MTEGEVAEKRAWTKYWPALLFAVSNVAALTLVIKANNAVETPTDSPRTALAEPWGTPAADAPFDSLSSSGHLDGQSPLLWDFGSDFDLDRKAADRGSLGFLDRARNRLQELKDKAIQGARLDRRKTRERELLSQPWNLNYYDTAGNFLGRHSISPPWTDDIPPLPALDNYQLRSGGHDVSVSTDGNRTMILRVDPQWFKDTASMTAFVTELADRMIVAGIQPQLEVGRLEAGGARPLGVDAGRGTVVATAPTVPTGQTAVVLPPGGQPTAPVTGRVPTNQALPKPPSDIRAAMAPPPFETMGDRLPSPPDDIRTAPAPGPLPQRPDGIASVARSGGATVPPPAPVEAAPAAPPASEARPTPPAETPAPAAKPPTETRPAAAPPAEARPAAATKPEPRVRLQIQLSQIADRRRAEEAVARLQAAGFGGQMRQSSGGLNYWLVQTRVFTTRKEATAALAKIKSMGYDAWFS